MSGDSIIPQLEKNPVSETNDEWLLRQNKLRKFHSVSWLVTRTRPKNKEEQQVSMKSSEQFPTHFKTREIRLPGSAADVDFVWSCRHDCSACSALSFPDPAWLCTYIPDSSPPPPPPQNVARAKRSTTELGYRLLFRNIHKILSENVASAVSIARNSGLGVINETSENNSEQGRGRKLSWSEEERLTLLTINISVE